MACLDMFNSEHPNGGLAPNMSPRISFSNDFVDTNQMISHEKRTPAISTSRSDQVSTDFEFSVTNYNMMAADELFSKGRLLPYKPNCSNSNQFQPKMTLREELLHDEEEDRTMSSSPSSRPPKGPSRWKELLGLKRSHIVSRKPDKKSMFAYEEEARASKSSQDAFKEEDSGR